MNMFKGRLKGLMIPSCIAHFGRLIVSRFFFSTETRRISSVSDIALCFKGSEDHW